MSLDDNPYSENAQEAPEVQLFNIYTIKNKPVVDYSAPLYSFPPIGQVKVRKEANTNTDEHGGRKRKASAPERIELKGFKSGEVEFDIELHSDEEGEGDGMSALDKYEQLCLNFLTLDSKKRNMRFGIRYPMVDKAGITTVFFKRFHGEDTPGQDLIKVNVVLHEIMPNQIVVGDPGSGVSTGSSKTANKSDGSKSGGDKAPNVVPSKTSLDYLRWRFSNGKAGTFAGGSVGSTGLSDNPDTSNLNAQGEDEGE